MLRSASAEHAHPFEPAPPWHASDAEIHALERLAGQLQVLAGALRDATSRDRESLLRPALEAIPDEASSLPEWVRVFLERYLRDPKESSFAPAGQATATCGDSRIDRALSYIRAHCRRQTLTLSDVSEFVRMSRWHFSRLLTRYVGMSFRDLVRIHRMDDATVLLDADELTIKEIAAELGFAHSTEFDRQFKHTFGVTPTTWRARRRHGPAGAFPLSDRSSNS
jgi:AraC-like DNA-binding protein